MAISEIGVLRLTAMIKGEEVARRKERVRKLFHC